MKKNKYTTEKDIELLRIEIEEAKRTNIKSKRNKLVKFAIYTLIYLLLFSTLISVFISKHSGETPQIFGYQLYIIRSASMSPTLETGSIILSKKPADATTLKVGDIVTFSQAEAIITHRIIEVVNEGSIKYRTKGDNPSNTPDVNLLSPENIKAVFVMKLY
ncbi:signal peptidase I [Ruminiclostridium herbifermentans]|uniref:Signal peptidase I n=1 Tax=Ruminiclostridium herbifermentans TaxID=2488810 RepID=A0A4U7JMH5_9FIRM|nr:signal peptidase I [Ruminiclostridium herbifermentans]QNU65345.1 signal peptidase I [Ruminiclostridium herbifermentans]